MNHKKILIVDDEKHVLKLIQLKLKEEGFTVYTAESALDGIEKAKKNKPDLILMDLMMDKISGLEAISHIKTCEATASIPILVLSGKSLEEDKEECRQAGANGFITKPILPNRLFHEIKKFL